MRCRNDRPWWSAVAISRKPAIALLRSSPTEMPSGSPKRSAVLADVDRALIAASGEGLVGNELFLDFAHPKIRTHQWMAETIARAMRSAGVPVNSADWRDGYRDSPTSELYRDKPRLKFLEVRSSVLICLLVQHPDCTEKAKRLDEMDRGNGFAQSVLDILAAKEQPREQRQ